MDLIEQCYNYLFWGALVVLAVQVIAFWTLQRKLVAAATKSVYESR